MPIHQWPKFILENIIGDEDLGLGFGGLLEVTGHHGARWPNSVGEQQFGGGGGEGIKLQLVSIGLDGGIIVHGPTKPVVAGELVDEVDAEGGAVPGGVIVNAAEVCLPELGEEVAAAGL